VLWARIARKTRSAALPFSPRYLSGHQHLIQLYFGGAATLLFFGGVEERAQSDGLIALVAHSARSGGRRRAQALRRAVAAAPFSLRVNHLGAQSLSRNNNNNNNSNNNNNNNERATSRPEQILAETGECRLVQGRGAQAGRPAGELQRRERGRIS
jgi:hypothetical protein